MIIARYNIIIIVFKGINTGTITYKHNMSFVQFKIIKCSQYNM